GGLGSAAAVACAAAGASVVLLGRRLPRLEHVYDACAAVGPEPLLYPLDLEGAGPADHVAVAERIAAELGGLHGLLHCAADFAGLTPLEHTDPAAFARALHVNLTAAAWLTGACLPLLRAVRGAVVFVLAEPDVAGAAYWGGYGVAQAGLEALVRMLRAETGGAPRVEAFRPGPMKTGLRARAWAEETGQPADPAAVAGRCVELLAGPGHGSP
ncbi:MAG: SDR family NAD(P)-dependent oxidoreductase, partial [Pseudoxanthomonas sp.]